MRRISLIAASVLGLGLASCYSFIGRYTIKTSAQKPYVDAKGTRYWYVEVAALNNRPRREAYVEELFDCAPTLPLVEKRENLIPLRSEGQPNPVSTNDAIEGDLVFRAGFLSDVHIREPAVKLFNDEISRSLDHVINSFERNGYQEAFQNSVYAATISAFNNLDGTDVKPRLIINTGDATDAGTIQEAYDFAAITHHLRYPLLYALGNHDDAIFGNYKHWIGYTKDAGPTFYPVGQKARFLMFFNETRTIGGFSDKLVPLPSNLYTKQNNLRWAALDFPRENDPGVETEDPTGPCVPGYGGCKQRSYCAGFDLGAQVDLRGKCEKAVGYYDVTVPGDNGTMVQLIGLNTTKEVTWGQGGTMDDIQRQWLKRQLTLPATVSIVFMHHPIHEVDGLAEILNEAAVGRPVVALTAHDHSFGTTWHGKFWEINTGALEVFPQWARLIEIRRGTNGRFYLNSRSLRPTLPLITNPPDVTAYGVPPGLPVDNWDQLEDDVRERVAPWVEWMFNVCDEIARAPSIPCKQGKGDWLAASAQCGYLGAVYDHGFRKEHPFPSGRMTWGRTNFVVDMSP